MAGAFNQHYVHPGIKRFRKVGPKKPVGTRHYPVHTAEIQPEVPGRVRQRDLQMATPN
jgi:hypothetical protein